MPIQQEMEWIAQQFGVPLRIFQGTAPVGTLSGIMENFEKHRVERLQEEVTAHLLGLLELQLPELLFWEVWFVCSPGVKVMRKRVAPVIRFD